MKIVAQNLRKALSPELASQARLLDTDCTRCRACVVQCAFLQRYGTPGDIAAALLAGGAASDPYACSLCNLCTSVCPANIAPGAFFLQLRRHIAGGNQLQLAPYSTILGYEQRGHSRLFSWYGLPRHCDTVFFPGCSLSGTRAKATWWLYQQLKAIIPQLGVVLDCCHKPSHDLGRQDFFHQRFTAIRARLTASGIRRIIVACPNCYKVFQEYGQPLDIQTAWEILAATPDTTPSPVREEVEVTLHDPCPLRDHHEVHQAVRALAGRHHLKITEMRHSRTRTICCGEGGSAGFVHADLARQWGHIRRQEAGGRPVITYCAGCAGFLARTGLKTFHLIDLLADPHKTLSGHGKPARAPWTYLHRLRLKRRLHKSMRSGPQKTVEK